MKHKHAELIKAWADGAEIQKIYIGVFPSEEQWDDDPSPDWDDDRWYFRIKPEEKKPVVRWLWASFCQMDKSWKCGERFYSDAEMNKVGLVKLEWSRTEFPE